VTQEVLRTEDLPAWEGDELSEFLVEPDACRPAGHVEMTEDQDRLAKVANLLNLGRETFPCSAAIVVPGLSRTIKTPVGGFVALQGGLNGGMPLTSGSSSAKKASRSSAFQASRTRRTVSTFSWDIARSVSREAVSQSGEAPARPQVHAGGLRREGQHELSAHVAALRLVLPSPAGASMRKSRRGYETRGLDGAGRSA
jgi:hypothetical protein